jgi:arabinogalactan oligomer/maltooligosaccharide transport system substrate-binding protein
MVRIRSTLIIAAVVALVAAACASNTATSPSPSASQAAGGTTQPVAKRAPVQLLVWSHLQQPEVDEVDKVAQAWAKTTGDTVKVLLDPGDFAGAVTAIQGGKGPDIMYGVPHDNLGQFFKAGQLAAVPAATINNADYTAASIAACSYDGKLYAVPVSEEAIGLFYRTDKVKTLPATFDELVTQAKTVGFQYDIKNFYFSYGFIGGNGGYVFKDKGVGALDQTDIGLGNDGAKAGYKQLQDLVVANKLMPADVNGDAAKAAFIDGKSSFYISGPWDVDGLKKANVPFAVAPIPSLAGGKKFQPFLGVQAAFVNAKAAADKQAAAWELVKELQSKLPLPLFNVGNRIPAQKSILSSPAVKGNANLAAFASSADSAVPMPNIAAMGAVWGPAGNALDLLVQNKLTPDAAATKVLTEVKDGIAQQK